MLFARALGDSGSYSARAASMFCIPTSRRTGLTLRLGLVTSRLITRPHLSRG